MRLSCLVLGIAISSVGHTASLRTYREGLLKSSVTAAAGTSERLLRLREALGTAHLPELNEGITSHSARHFRSATIVKDALRNATREVIRAKALDAPVPFNPGWTRAEHKQIQLIEARKMCLRSIQHSRLDGYGQPAGMEAVLGDLHARLRQKADDGEGANTSEEAPIEDADQKAQALVSALIRTAPVNKEGQSITALLGAVQAAETADDALERVQMGAGDQAIYLSLPMLLTYRTGQDDAFVQLQDCLYEYLGDQQQVFARRVRQAAASPNWFAQVLTKVKSWFTQIDLHKGRIAETSRNAEQGEAEVRELYVAIETSAKPAREAARYKFFLEGHEFKDEEDERAFIGRRLALAGGVVEYLKTRVSLAHRVSDQLRGLSRAQVDYLLDLFLRLNAANLPTVEESAEMGELFASRGESVAADAMFFGLLGQQLTELEMKLSAEKMDAVARAKDLSQIFK